MDQNQEVAVQSAVDETTQTDSPQVEVPTTEEQTPQGQATQEEVLDVESSEPSDPREFQARRLAEENKRLKAELEGKPRSSAFDAFRPTYAPTEPTYNPYGEQTVDPRMVNTLVEQTVSDRLDEYQARNKYPELFSDPDTEQEIADRWFAAKMRGEEAPISAIAERVAARFQKAVSRAEKAGAEKVLTQVSPKEQAALGVQGQTSTPARQAQSALNDEQLSERSRQGDTDAIAERMKRVPWANK